MQRCWREVTANRCHDRLRVKVEIFLQHGLEILELSRREERSARIQDALMRFAHALVTLFLNSLLRGVIRHVQRDRPAKREQTPLFASDYADERSHLIGPQWRILG